jgi:hypothetical protein
MWPWKRTPALTMAQYAETRPTAQCGKQEDHVFWTEIQGMPCPICTAKINRELKEEDENRMAEKIADVIIRRMSL